MERRLFIKTTCTLCAALGAGLTVASFSSCASIPVYAASVSRKRIAVPLSIFGEQNVQIVRANELEYDIALRKESDGRYTALLLRCTHASNPLTVTESGFVCPLHGSRFGVGGDVTHGPATIALKQLATSIEDDKIVIALE